MPKISCQSMAIIPLFGFLITHTVVAAEETPIEYGPAICHSVTFVKPENHNAATWPGAVTRAIVADLPHETTLCYDAEHLSVVSAWQGDLLDFSKTHHTSYKGSLPPRPAVQPLFQSLNQAGWATPDGPLQDGEAKLAGYYLHGEELVLALNVAGRKVWEVPSAVTAGLFRRTFHIAAGEQALSLLVATASNEPTVDGTTITANVGEQPFAAKVDSVKSQQSLRHREGKIWIDVPASSKPQIFDLFFAFGELASKQPFSQGVASADPISDPITKTQGGPRRWKKDFITQGQRAPDNAAYVVDDLGVPEKPYGRYMRLSAIDFFEDGRAAVATLPGDVWIVTFDPNNLSEVRWVRYATGLYEPLGIAVADGQIIVRGRDRMTRLHDLNGNGEADYYENFHSQGPIGPGYHAFVFDLVTDEDDNFYFALSGRKAPTKGQVVKVSPDGQSRETVCTWFRHANGMGSGGPYGWVTIGDNPDGKYPSGASIVRDGASYGEMGGPRTEPMLYVLPPKVDTSTASQCWTDSKRWGPLSDHLIHTSYSTSTLTYVNVHNSQPHPSGYAVHMPFTFKSGVMRLRVNPVDGQLYIAGQRGWDSNAANDGCLHRLRYTGKPAYLVTDAKATPEGIQLTFSCELDESTIDYDNVYAARVGGKGEKEVDIEDVEKVDDHTLLVIIDDINPSEIVDERATKKLKENNDDRTAYRVVDPLAITFNLKAADGTPVKDTIYCTINGY